MAGGETMVGWLEQWGVILFPYLVDLAGALAVLVLGLWAVRLVSRMVQRGLRKAEVEETLVSFGGNLLRYGLAALVVVAAMQQVGVQTTSIIAVLGAAGLAVALSLQSQLSNLAAGIMLLIFRPFRLGQVIEGAGVLGTVEQISIMTTWLKTPDGRTVIVPNNKMIADNIVNLSMKPIRRIDLVVGVGYGDDLPRAKQLLLQLIQDDPRVLPDPAPSVDVLELGESSVDLGVRPWVKTEDFWAARCDLLQALKLGLDREGINIPYPQRDVHLLQEAPPAPSH